MNALAQLGAIGIATLAAAGGTYLVKGPPLPKIACDPKALKAGEICLQQIGDERDVLWIDARRRVDWQRDGLPGAVLWSLESGEDQNAFGAELAARIMSSPRVIVYCSSQRCTLSHEVAARISKLDLGAEVLVLRGGWEALRDAGRVKDAGL